MGSLCLTPLTCGFRQVHGAFVLLDLLTPDECTTLLNGARQMGFTPDHPLSRPKPSGIGACEWLVDDHVLSPLFERCRHLLPQTMSGGELAGGRSTHSALHPSVHLAAHPCPHPRPSARPAP